MIAFSAVVYVFVLVGSFAGICALLGLRVLMRNRSVRKFVRSVRQRVQLAESRAAVAAPETKVERKRGNPRASAIRLQEARSLMRDAEKSFARGKVQEAERAFIKALTLMPDAQDVHAQLARFYLQTERPQKAEAMYRELIGRHDDVSYHANLALACYRQGKYSDACESYAAALARDEKNPDRHAALGRACVAAGRYAEAAPYLEQACTRLSRDTELLSLLAECYLQVSNTDAAQETYRRINRLEPYNEEVKQRLQELATV